MQTLVNRKNLKHAAVVLLFVLPAFIPLFIFWLYPIGRSIWLSFTDWDFMTPEYHFVWFKNYQALLKDSRFMRLSGHHHFHGRYIDSDYCRWTGTGTSASEKF